MENIFFYPVFICQILLLSWYLPSQQLKRLDWILTHFPQQEYPKLYPIPLDAILARKRRFAFANNVILLLGTALLIGTGYWDSQADSKISNLIPWAFFMLQMSPSMVAEMTGLRIFRIMRELNNSAVRKATLSPRKLTDYVSKGLLVSAVLAYVVMMLWVFYIFDFSTNINHVPVMSALILLLGNAFFATIIYWNVYGKKPDPHQDPADHKVQVSTVVTSLLYVSIGMSLFMAMMASSNKFGLNLDSAILISLVCQLLALGSMGIQLQKLKPENLNYEGYRKDGAT